MLVYGHTVDESGRVKVTDAQLKTQIQNIRQRGGEGEGSDGGDEGGGEGATDVDADAPIDAGGDSRVRQLSWQPKGGKGSVDNALETTKRPAILKDKELKPRTVAVGAPGGGEEAVSVTVWEVAEPQAMMENAGRKVNEPAAKEWATQKLEAERTIREQKEQLAAFSAQVKDAKARLEELAQAATRLNEDLERIESPGAVSAASSGRPATIPVQVITARGTRTSLSQGPAFVLAAALTYRA